MENTQEDLKAIRKELKRLKKSQEKLHNILMAIFANVLVKNDEKGLLND